MFLYKLCQSINLSIDRSNYIYVAAKIATSESGTYQSLVCKSVRCDAGKVVQIKDKSKSTIPVHCPLYSRWHMSSSQTVSVVTVHSLPSSQFTSCTHQVHSTLVYFTFKVSDVRSCKAGNFDCSSSKISHTVCQWVGIKSASLERQSNFWTNETQLLLEQYNKVYSPQRQDNNNDDNNEKT